VKDASAVLHNGKMLYVNCPLAESKNKTSRPQIASLKLDKISFTLTDQTGSHPPHCTWPLVLSNDKYLVLMGGSRNFTNKLYLCNLESMEWESRDLKYRIKIFDGKNGVDSPGFIWNNRIYCFVQDYFYYDLTKGTETTFTVQCNRSVFRFAEWVTKMTVLYDRVWGITTFRGNEFASFFEFDPETFRVTFYDLAGRVNLSCGYGFALHADPMRGRLVVYGGCLGSNANGTSDMYFIDIWTRRPMSGLIKMMYHQRCIDVRFRFK
jgi:hypothetical protein